MNATERVALLQGLELYDEMSASVDERTLEILDRRRRTAVVKRRGWLVRRVLLLADLVGLVAALLLAEWLVNRHSGKGTLDAQAEIVAFLATLPGWVVIAKLYGLYDRDEEQTDHSTTDDFAGVFHLVTVCTWVVWVGAYVTKLAHPTVPKLLIFWAAAVTFITIGRSVARALARRNIVYLQNTVIVGAGDVGQLIARKLLHHPEYGINLVGLVDSNPKERDHDLEHIALLGGPERLPAIVRLFDVERVVVAFSNEPHEKTLELVRSLKDLDMQIDIVPRLFETVGPNVGLHMLEGLPLVSLPPLRLSRSSALLKRAMDIALAGVGLVLLSPLFLAIAVAVKLDSRGPAFYRHERVGRGRRRIEVLKFRTMRLEACRGSRYGGESAEETFEALMADGDRAREFRETYKLTGDPRVTPVGHLLRKTSLDELPQLINVVTGELSLVGPRAITVDELERYGDRADDLLGVRPGVTGYWQINGRSRLSYEDRVRLDLAYITGWSLRLDLEILGKTLRVLFTRRGAV
jgi:exopolysaccharide biosynthesis polyprenyl glycosylphosphotransferase